MEQELANLDPSRPGVSSGTHNRMDVMSEVSSLHDGLDPRSRGRAQPRSAHRLYDHDDNMSTISSVSQQGRRDNYDRRGGAAASRAPPAAAPAPWTTSTTSAAVTAIRDDYPPQRREGGARGGRRGSDDGWSGSGGGGRGGQDRDRDTPRRRDYSPDDRRGYQGKRSRSRDDLMDLERGGRARRAR
ncbi:hypothetical protein ANANG_G00002590 [Anguilla anguilla]|uniref:Uncharacterized protein n=1 Tax=Anguilla anguilla TaxID=7936 RepID=A0A9D3MXG0_ANGAN|nr:hypothetical protein ANANG_G00002590 [Anguilla anguilla]